MDWDDLFFTPKESRLIELIDLLKYGEAVAYCHPFPAHRSRRLRVIYLACNPKSILDLDFARCTPLHRAITQGAPLGLVQCLVAVWPEIVRKPNRGGKVPLHLAAGCGSTDETIMAYLVSLYPGALLLQDKMGFIPLNYACMFKNPAQAEFLIPLYRQSVPSGLRNICNAGMVNMGQGMGPIHMAVNHCYVSECKKENSLPALRMVKALLAADSEAAKHRSLSGETALHVAAKDSVSSTNAELMTTLLLAYPDAAFETETNAEGEPRMPPAILNFCRQHLNWKRRKNWLLALNGSGFRYGDNNHCTETVDTGGGRGGGGGGGGRGSLDVKSQAEHVRVVKMVYGCDNIVRRISSFI